MKNKKLSIQFGEGISGMEFQGTSGDLLMMWSLLTCRLTEQTGVSIQELFQHYLETEAECQKVLQELVDYTIDMKRLNAALRRRNGGKNNADDGQ